MRSDGARTRVAQCFVVACAVALQCLGAGGAQAAYPERPITLVIPFAPGGPTDIIARILSVALTQSLGQSIIVDNRGGAAGNIGMGQVARAAPDGYTLLLTSTAIAVNPALFKNLPYDPFKDFLPISELVNAPNVLVVRGDSGIKTIADLVAQAKANPAKFNYASPGAGTKSQLTGELLKLRAGIQMVHVPFRGAGPAAQAVLANTVAGRIGRAGGGRAADQGRPVARARGHQQEALVLAARRADHDRGGLSRFHLGHVQRAVRARRIRRRQSCRCWCAKAAPPSIAPEAHEQARKAGFEVVAGTPEQLAARVAAEVPAVAISWIEPASSRSKASAQRPCGEPRKPTLCIVAEGFGVAPDDCAQMAFRRLLS